MFRSLLMMSALFAGCADVPDDPLSADAPVDAGSDLRGTPAIYYTLAVDTRKCASPLCGGYFVTELNHATMTCADGTTASSCYIAYVDGSKLGFIPADKAAFDAALSDDWALVRGRLTLEPVSGYTLGVLSASEAWEGLTGMNPGGSFVRVNENGMLCLTTPCTHYDESALNGHRSTLIAELDFKPSAADPTQIREAIDATLSTDGLLVAGKRYPVTGPGGTSPARDVTEAYVRIGY